MPDSGSSLLGRLSQLPMSSMPTDTPQIYAPSNQGALRQCEIISDLLEPIVEPGSIRDQGDGPLVRRQMHPFAVVVSQDCDLEQDFQARQGAQISQDKLLQNVLFCDVFEIWELITTNSLHARELRKRLINNKDERHHFLERIAAEYDSQGVGLPDLGIDFKRYFSLSTEEIYKQLSDPNASAKRRCRLHSPYLEHLSTRFCYYQFRIALPIDHTPPLPPGNSTQ